MKKPTIADVLHRAADFHLYSEMEGQQYIRNRIVFHSCCAVDDALEYLFDLYFDTDTWYTPKESKIYDDFRDQVFEGLEEMGLNTDSVSAFAEIQREDRQQYRYAWLKFAAMIAEEQGV